MPRLLRLIRTIWLAPFSVALVLAAPAAAQEIDQEAPAHISVVEGAVILERDGKSDTAPGSMPLLAGDRVRTQNGRAEILFADGSTLHLDAGTVVDFQSDEVIRLLDGRVRININGPNRRVAYRIDAPSAWVQIAQPGEYRVSLVGTVREVELAVLRGSAELVNEDGTTMVRAGERAFAATGAAPSQPYIFNSAAWDSFDRWSEARREQRLGISAEYLPDAVQPYASTFNSYGSWQYEPTYGRVWYPRVAVGWRPYYYGRWSHLRPFGWTWIGHDPWAWPTHHFGRWGFSGGAWFWIPGRTWGPAWVSWASAPGFVSWCPLGWNNRPLFSFVNVNVFGGRSFHGWHGWTVVPHRRFSSGFVNINVVNVDRLDDRIRRGFAVRDGGPAFSGQAVTRAQAPIRVAGTRSGFAVPRDAGATAPRAGDRESFRSRGSAGTSLNGPGFPAAAREPRASPSTRTRESAGSSRAVERAPGSSSERASSPRAVPQQDERAPGRAIERSAVERAQPQNQRSSSAGVSRAPSAAAPPAPSPERSRAVPRSESDSAPSNVPNRTYGIERSDPRAPQQIERYPSSPRGTDSPAYQPDRSMRRAPEQPQYGGPRAVPRSDSPYRGDSPVYRPEPGVGRAPSAERPAGPPPGSVGTPSPRSAEPSRAAPPPSRGSGSSGPPASGSRGGGGQPTGRTAVPRGGRG